MQFFFCPLGILQMNFTLLSFCAIKVNVHIACLRHMTSNQMIIVQKETFVMQVMAQLQL